MMEQEKTLKEKIKGSYRPGQLDRTHYIHYLDPDDMESADRILYYDKRTLEDIKTLEKEIETLKEYRLLLAERYNLLETAPTAPVITLKREKSYYENKVYYYLIESKKYLETGKEVQVNSTKYPGAERKQAINAYNEYVKAHPGIIAVMDIAKGKWER